MNAPIAFRRYVALGDSTTEGLEDPDPTGGFRGWADRLAERLARLDPGFLYANLAIRGRKMAQIRAEQLEPAMAMAPDLASIIGGINDILRPKVDLDTVAGDIEAMVAALRGGGATVLMLTYPDPAKIMPFARGTSPRVLAYNNALREIAARHEARLMDLGRYGVVDPRLWHPDRLHANSEGHERIALTAADVARSPRRDRRVAHAAATGAARVQVSARETRGRLGRPLLRALGRPPHPRPLLGRRGSPQATDAHARPRRLMARAMSSAQEAISAA